MSEALEVNNNTLENQEQELNEKYYTINIEENVNSESFTVYITDEQFTSFRDRFVSYNNFLERTKDYCIIALRNFIKREMLDEILEKHEEEMISEEEFEGLINDDKYIISLRKLVDTQDLIIINDIIDQIGYDLKEFSVNDVSQMFSIDPREIIGLLNSE